MRIYMLTLGLFGLIGLGTSSCGVMQQATSMPSTPPRTLLDVQPGMSYQEVVDILGKPAYRSFEGNRETFEFHRTFRGKTTRIFVDFVDRRVVSMQSEDFGLRAPAPRSEPQPQMPIIIDPTPRPRPRDYDYDYGLGGRYISPEEQARWFADLQARLARTPFDDDKLTLLRAALTDQYITTSQVGQLLHGKPFDDDKMKILRICAPRIIDRERAYTLLDAFTFDSAGRQAAKILRLDL